MAKKRKLSAHQKGIVRRYYENQEAISTQRLGEIVTELYLCTSEKRANQLWGRAEKALRKSNANKAWLEKCLADRDIESLAKLVGTIF